MDSVKDKDNPLRIEERIYPWGRDIDANRLNFDETGINTTSVVGCFENGASSYGCEEMCGNVGEWTRSLDYEKFGYPYNPVSGCENMEADKDTISVLLGGCFGNSRRGVRCALRNRHSPDDGNSNIGFRIVLSPF